MVHKTYCLHFPLENLVSNDWYACKIFKTHLNLSTEMAINKNEVTIKNVTGNPD